MKFVVNKNRKRKMLHVKNVILDTIIDCKLYDKLIVDKIRQNWSDVVGALLAIHSRPEYIRNSVLYITVDNPVYSNEIVINKEFIISKLIKKFEMIKLQDIRTKIGNIRR